MTEKRLEYSDSCFHRDVFLSLESFHRQFSSPQAYTIFGFPASKKEKCFLAIDDDSKVEVKMFFDKDEYQFIVFTGPSEGVMAAQSEMLDLAKLKKKAIIMHKVGSAKITKEKYMDQVIFLETTKDIMTLLNSYCHSVYLSTLSNPANQKGWYVFFRIFFFNSFSPITQPAYFDVVRTSKVCMVVLFSAPLLSVRLDDHGAASQIVSAARAQPNPEDPSYVVTMLSRSRR